jgi:class 3 adenylate cyclase
VIAEALRRHDDLLRAAVQKNGGYVFKTVGDAVYAVFWRASDALLAASDGHNLRYVRRIGALSAI